MGTKRPTGNLLDIIERLTKDVRRLKAKVTAGSGSSALDAWPIGSIFISAVATDPATLLGGGTWASFGEGRVLVGVDSGDPDFDTVEETGGAKTHTLTEDEMPSHTHSVDPPATNTGNPSANHTHSIDPPATNTGGFSANHTHGAGGLTAPLGQGTGSLDHTHVDNSGTFAGTIHGGAGSPSTGIIGGSTGTVSANHVHSVDIGAFTSGTVSAWHTHSVDIAAFNSASAGGGEAHNNLQPYITVHMWKRTA